MISNDQFREMAMALGEVEERPHFEKNSFRVKKKIFATLDNENRSACLKLSEIDQDVFCASNREAIQIVPNAWGKQGWTNFDLQKVRKTVLRDALRKAHDMVGSSKKAK